MQASALPTLGDIGRLLAYVFGNPYLFVSSTTVMTSGLLLGAVLVSVLPQRAHMLRRDGPTLVLILAYFGLGSIVLSSEILLRFHDTIPDETETQFVSGVGISRKPRSASRSSPRSCAGTPERNGCGRTRLPSPAGRSRSRS